MNPIRELINQPVIYQTGRFTNNDVNHLPTSLWNIIRPLFNFLDSIFIIPPGSDFKLPQFSFQRRKEMRNVFTSQSLQIWIDQYTTFYQNLLSTDFPRTSLERLIKIFKQKTITQGTISAFPGLQRMKTFLLKRIQLNYPKISRLSAKYLKDLLGDRMALMVFQWVQTQRLGHQARFVQMSNLLQRRVDGADQVEQIFGFPTYMQQVQAIQHFRIIAKPLPRAHFQGQAKAFFSYTQQFQQNLLIQQETRPPMWFIQRIRALLFPVIYYHFIPLLYVFHFQQEFTFNISQFRNAVQTITNRPITIYVDMLNINNDHPWTLFPFQLPRIPWLQILSRFQQGNIEKAFIDLLNSVYRRFPLEFYTHIVTQANANFEHYLIQQNDRNYLQVKNFLISGFYIPLINMLQITNVTQPRFDMDRGIIIPNNIITNIIRSTGLLHPDMQMPSGLLNWRFYGKSKKPYTYQFDSVEPKCIDNLNWQLISKGYQQCPLHQAQNQVQTLKKYCIDNQIPLRLLGNKQYIVDHPGKQYHILATPNHVQLIIKKPRNQVQKSFGKAASFLTIGAIQKKNKLIVDQHPFGRPSVQQWQIGMQLPLDPQQDAFKQILLRNNCLVIDIQTLSSYQQRMVPYMICCVGYPKRNDKIMYRCWSNTQYQTYQNGKKQKLKLQNPISKQICIQKFVQWLCGMIDQIKEEQPLVIWGFNMMGMELVYILNQLTKSFGWVQLQGAPNQCKIFSIANKKVVFGDVLKILPPQRLGQLCRQFKIIINKQQFKIQHINTWNKVRENYGKIKQYCYYDCVSTLLLIHKIHLGFFQIAKTVKVSYAPQMITQRFTASGLGWFFFIQGFFKRNIINGFKQSTNLTFYNNQPFDVYQKQRKSLTGGVVQVFRYYYSGKIYVVDINSMYPAMLLRDLPWVYRGKCQIFQLQSILQQQQSQLYLFEVFSYQFPVNFKGAFVATKQIPKSPKNTYYNTYQGEPIYIRGIVIKRMLFHKCKIQVGCCYRYSSEGITAFRQFAETFYQQRLKTTSKSLKACYKLLMNSVIGRCSMGPKKSYTTTLYPKTDDFIPYQNGTFLDSTQQVLPQVGRLVRISAHITDSAKVYLDQLAFIAGYDNVCYCDTDSLMVTEQGYLNLGSPGTKASVLGQFKCQGPDQSPYNYFIQGLFKNRKDYMLQYYNKQMKKVIQYKAKGIPKKFINQQYCGKIAKQFMQILPTLQNQPAQFKVVLKTQVSMQVWRRNFKQQGITIKGMNKKSSIIVDRWFPNVYQTGIPRSQSKKINVNNHDFL